MTQKITDALLNTNIDNISLNCNLKLSMTARFVGEKMVTCYDNGVYLIMSSYDLTDKEGNIYSINCYFKDIVGTIIDIDVKL